MGTIKIKSTHPESQGPFVIINESDFDADKHALYVEGDADANGDGKVTVAEIKAKLDALKIEYPAGAKKADLLTLLENSEKD
jgi:hypothetical protein